MRESLEILGVFVEVPPRGRGKVIETKTFEQSEPIVYGEVGITTLIRIKYSPNKGIPECSDEPLAWRVERADTNTHTRTRTKKNHDVKGIACC